MVKGGNIQNESMKVGVDVTMKWRQSVNDLDETGEEDKEELGQIHNEFGNINIDELMETWRIRQNNFKRFKYEFPQFKTLNNR